MIDLESKDHAIFVKEEPNFSKKTRNEYIFIE